jgi:hypothetical protein
VEARHEDTVEAYERFMVEYPDQPMVAAAKKRVEQICYLQAKSVGTREAYESFLARFPDGVLAAKARAPLKEHEEPAVAYIMLGGEKSSVGVGRGAQARFQFGNGRPLYGCMIWRALRGTDDRGATETRPARPRIYPMFGVAAGTGLTARTPWFATSVCLGLSGYAWPTSRKKTAYYSPNLGVSFGFPIDVEGGTIRRRYNVWDYALRPTLTIMLGHRDTRMLWVAFENGDADVFPGGTVSVGFAWGAP